MNLTGEGTVQALSLTGEGTVQALSLTGIVGRSMTITGVADVTIVEVPDIVTGNPIGLLLALTYTV